MSAQVPPQFQHEPAAAATSWGPLVRGGASFRTRELRQVSADRQEFVATRGMMLAPLFVFVLMVIQTGMCIFIYRFFAGDMELGELWEKRRFVPLFGLGFGALGCVMMLGAATFLWFAARRPVVLDRPSGFFWKGTRDPSQADPATIRNCALLSESVGLQILSEYVVKRDNEGAAHRFHSFELNLVLSDASRVNIVDHGNLKALRNDAAMVAEFLSVPVWDATLQSKPS
ncbi:MAG: hypothetical protein H8E37_01415 [Planctomycetes bacterium]|nr:hypothetical protein [Planctomycetota bacterium]